MNTLAHYNALSFTAKKESYNIQLNDAQHKMLICDNNQKLHSAYMTLSITTQCNKCHYAECHYAECHYAECRSTVLTDSHF